VRRPEALREPTGAELPNGQRVRALSATQRAIIVEALASALVEEYLAETQQLAGSTGESPGGIARV
jgi:hypothetical protein